MGLNIDYSKNREIIFKCSGDVTITEADKLFETTIGKHPSKLNNVGCFNSGWGKTT